MDLLELKFYQKLNEALKALSDDQLKKIIPPRPNKKRQEDLIHEIRNENTVMPRLYLEEAVKAFRAAKMLYVLNTFQSSETKHAQRARVREEILFDEFTKRRQHLGGIVPKTTAYRIRTQEDFYNRLSVHQYNELKKIIEVDEEQVEYLIRREEEEKLKQLVAEKSSN